MSQTHHFRENSVEFIEKNIELVLIAIVGISLIPVALELLRNHRRGRAVAR